MLNDNELKEELSSLSNKEQVRFMKLLQTFNHRGGSSSNSKINRALDAAKYKSNNTIQGGGGLFSEFKNMFGGVSQNLNNVKELIIPNFLKEDTTQNQSENMDGGKFNNTTIKENTAPINYNNNNRELEERVDKLEQSISLLNDTLNSMNNDNNVNTEGNNNTNSNNNQMNNNMDGGSQKKKDRKKYKKKGAQKGKKTIIISSYKKKQSKKNKKKRKTQLLKSKKLK